MRKKLLDYIVCPDCKGRFRLIAIEGNDEVGDGILRCESCNKVYPIIKSIPRILPDTIRDHPEFYSRNRSLIGDLKASEKELAEFSKLKERTKKSFGFQWTRYKTIHEEEETQIFFEKTGVSRDFLKGKLVLDGGCGYGRYTLVASRHGAEVIGVDLSNAVESACENTKGLNAHIVQADLFNLPFRDGTFDFVFSIGVLHHTPDSREAFKRLAPLVRRGGIMSVWVYKVRSPLSMFLNGLIRIFTTRIPHELLWKLSWIAVPLGGLVLSIKNERLRYHVGRVLFFISKRPYPKERWGDTFDWWSPHYEHFHTEEEVRGWFSESGFSGVKVNHRSQDDIGMKTFKDDVGVMGWKPG